MKMKLSSILSGLIAMLMLSAAASAVAVGNATNTTSVTQATSAASGTTASDPIIGGYIYNLTITTSTVSGKWAGLTGNLTSPLLKLYTGSNSTFKTWSLGLTGNSLIIATTNSSPTWGSLGVGSANDIDTAWGYNTNDPDSANKTFNETAGGVYIGGTGKASAIAKTLNGSSQLQFITNLVELGTVAGSSAGNRSFLVFAGNYSTTTSAYDNSNKTFQMIIPDNNDNGASTGTTYYFYTQV